MRLTVLKDEHPILRKKAQEIEDFSDPKLHTLIVNMIKTMKKKDGVGLAAPQVGQSIRLTVIDMKDGPLVLINPVINVFSEEKEVAEEGCLSVPGHYQDVARSTLIEFEATLPDGRKISKKAEGLLARVIQHEIDHLDGILIIDK